ncbi:glycosyltransferase family 25 protein [Cyanobium sp. LEGE 06113]|uniref:glycosyltransferase family 25 protein n=1 Tax=Cyanobium sp. LEGE 06113 TaxID=1297573 RepID=UPI00187F0254|nr:glycosyltransferase family 25 protein [Cyanobium sp. LEGE 06113]MBE9153309.1 glycosyltransferase family 25 protein [Cyanobium sp. LEGE 06113]
MANSTFLSHLAGALYFEDCAQPTRESDDYRVKLICLEDSTRLFSFVKHYPFETMFDLFEAVDARKTDFDYSKFLETNGIGPEPGEEGHLGCSLSHYKLWGQIANREKRWSLVVEDDAFFLPYAGDAISKAIDEAPNDADIIFVNGRTCEKLYSQVRFKDGSLTGIPNRFLFSRSELLQIMDSNYEYLQRSRRSGKPLLYCGTDGYLVSPRGARKLATFASSYGFGTLPVGRGNNVDLILCAITTSIGDHHSKNELVNRAQYKIRSGLIKEDAIISSYVTAYPVVDTLDRAGQRCASEIRRRVNR